MQIHSREIKVYQFCRSVRKIIKYEKYISDCSFGTFMLLNLRRHSSLQTYYADKFANE